MFPDVNAIVGQKTEVDLIRLPPKLHLPFKHCTFEEYEFVLRTMFVNKKIPLKESIRYYTLAQYFDFFSLKAFVLP